MQRQFARFVLRLILLFSGFAFSAGPLPTAKLSQALDLQIHYRNKLAGDQVIELSNDRERFIGLWMEQEISNPEGAVLFLHDVGQTPDWPYLLQQTRQYLPQVGWSTLSIHLPTPQRDAIGMLPPEGQTSAVMDETMEDWEQRVLERIATALGRLNNEGNFNIALLGYGDGAYWAARYLSERLSEEEEEGYALILVEPSTRTELASYIGGLTIPTLDLMMTVTDFTQRRARERKAAAMRAKHPDYLQIHDAARHGFYGSPSIDRSTRRVWGWLRNHASGYEAQLAEN